MKKYIFIGTAVFLLAMIAYIPASVAAKFLPNNIIASQFQGNLWNGSAASLVVNKIDYGSVKWKVKSSCFLLLKLCADINQSHGDVESKFHLKMRGSTEINDLTANGNADILSPLVKDYGISLSGNFDADIQDIQFDANGIQRLEGNMNFSTLDVNGVLRLSMGDVNSVFEPMSDHTHIDINNSQGHIDLIGAVQLFHDMKYDLDIKARQNESSSEAVINGLKFVGELQSDGSVKIQQSGKL
ncbi:MAG: type II secretion system protein N [Gammaproteobacteria bacterium]